MRSEHLSTDQRKLLDRLLGERPAAAGLPPITPSGASRDRLPLSFAQQRIWFFDQLEPGSPLYNMAGGARLRGAVDVEVLRRSLSEVVRRHEILRTSFHQDDGVPWASVREEAEVELPVIDLSGMPPADRAAAVAEYRRAEANRPFGLDRDVLLHALLLRVAADEHLLLVGLHHIAADGWSLGILFGELAELYRAYSAGAASPLPEPALQYADLTDWQQRHLAGPVLREHVDHWVAKLADAPLVELPTDRTAAQDSFDGATLDFELPAGLVSALRALGGAERATPYMVLLAGFATLLHRWSGQDDLVVGASVACRNRPEVADLVGCLVNMLPLRVDAADRPTFRRLLRRVRQTCLDGYAHQDAPFEQVVEELQPDRKATRTPLVRHSLVVHDAPSLSVELPGLSIEVMPVFTDTAKFDLKLELAPDGAGGMVGTAEYAVALFDPPTVARLVESLHTLLEDAAADPDRPIDSLRLFGVAERDRLLRAGHGRAAQDAACLHELVERAADATPDVVAVVDEEERLTYRQLDHRANAVAWLLRDMGVRAENRVAVCLNRSAELVAASLGVLKAGAAIVPLDPAYPKARLDFMIADCGARVVLTRSGLLPVEGAGAGDGPQVVLLDEVADGVAASRTDRPRLLADPRQAMYVIYTSGSTGTPKGVVVEHRALVNRLREMRDGYGFGADDVALCKTPLGFDVSIGEWTLPLVNGARVVMASAQDGHLDPAYLLRLVRKEGCTTINVVPSLLGALLDERDVADCATTLRRVLSGGEELPRELAARCHRTLPAVDLFNLYGPTEAAIDATTWPVADTGPDGAKVPIGRPVSGARLYVLDANLEPTPVGVPGELYIGGLPVARGYHDRPALTAARFVPDPFSAGGRLYRTGDRVRWRDGDVLEFLGRLDHQVKLRGQRIEPGEIEAALREHPRVARAVVTTYAGADDGALLVGYVSLAPRTGEPEAGLAKEITAMLEKRLPAHMVPSTIVIVDEWPVGPSGKLDRAALPAPQATATAGGAPRTETERKVLSIWREILQSDAVGVHDDFFAFGGHSLLAARLAARMRAEFGAGLPLNVLLREPTVAAVAAYLDAAGPAGPAPAPIPKIERRPPTG
ncbi:amino acid adenylation domain-containing protein [Nonomuraea sp. NPDC052116]|uniref:non-ribosomal peptide synthetase n=1 Tax=Nonomuraea sp. NPDC052116 TaxID=3155665 RepID=UPI003427AD7A